MSPEVRSRIYTQLARTHLKADGSTLWDHARTLQDWETNAELQLEFKGQTEIEVGYEETMERFAEVGSASGVRHSFSARRGSTGWRRRSGLIAGTRSTSSPGGGLRPFLTDGTEADAYQFTRSISLRAIVDYSAVLPDRELIDLDRDKRLTADVLLTYQLDPWTAAYVGYTDGYGISRSIRCSVTASAGPIRCSTRQDASCS